jgi:hypothetical protein
MNPEAIGAIGDLVGGAGVIAAVDATLRAEETK